MIIEKHLKIIDPTQTLVEFIKSEVDLNSSDIKEAIKKGCLWIERGKKINRLRRMKPKLETGQTLHFYYNSDVLKQIPQKAKLVSDHQDYSIWHKPAGMLSQGSKWSDHTTIKRFVEGYFNSDRQAIIVHRLDKMTEGLMIIAHKKKVAAQFTDLFSARKIHKTYSAIVSGNFNSEKYDPLKDSKDQTLLIDSNIDNKPAISHVKQITFDAKTDQSELEVKIETGRKHQIRKHLSSIGFPVLGDRLYGNEKTLDQKIDLQLKAIKLEFVCPITQKPMSLSL